MHHQELDVLDVADKESLVAGGHHEAGLLVGAIANLSKSCQHFRLRRMCRCRSFVKSALS